MTKMLKELIKTRALVFNLLLCLICGLIAGCGDTQVMFSADQTKARNITATPAEVADFQETRAVFLAVGDIMLSRGVNQMIEKENDPLLPYSRLEDLLESTDFNFGNLESPVSGNDKIAGRGLVFNARTKNIDGLIKYNFKILNLANNHALDQKLSGLVFTREYLEKQGISVIGAGENKAEAWQPQTITANKIRIGFIGASYSSINDGGASQNEYVARIEDIELLKAAIKELEPESDFIVVSMHAGIEYTLKPARAQKDFARAAIDAGADLVIGTHPHWVQTFEEYRGKYIFYSLGNFIFDQRQAGTKEGLTLRVTLARRQTKNSPDIFIRLEQIELIPVVIERSGVPRPAAEFESEAILKKIGADGRQIIKFPAQ